MKKLIVIGLTLAAAAWSVYAQGTVAFNNTSSTLVKYDPSVPGHTGEAVPTGSMRVSLYWGVMGSPENLLVQIGASGIDPTVAASSLINPVPGRYSGGTKTTGNATAPGATATFQARAWSAAFNSYEEAISMGGVNDFQGKSALFNAPTGGAGTPPSSPTPLAPLIPVFNVVQVPEPSVIALGILGLGSLLLFRRRK